MPSSTMMLVPMVSAHLKEDGPVPRPLRSRRRSAWAGALARSAVAG